MLKSQPTQKLLIFLLLLCSISLSIAQDWSGIPVPAQVENGQDWKLVDAVSDDFNYLAPANDKGITFKSKWKDSYVNGWTGSAPSYFSTDQSYVNGTNLVIDAIRKPNTTDAELTGSICALQPVVYPVFIETYAKLSKSVMASCFWLISLDQTQEIDIIEAFGTDRPNLGWYNQSLHLSHHVFIRSPWHDYQPTDSKSWYTNNGTVWSNDYHRIGVYWKDPLHLEYYVDGELVRVLHDKAFANKSNGIWYYSYPIMSNGVISSSGGYQTVTQYTTSTQFDSQKLQEASNISITSVIDPYNYTGTGLTKPMYIVANTGEQSWTGLTPLDSELNDGTKRVFLLDWIRVYKPEIKTSVPTTQVNCNKISVYPLPFKDEINIESPTSLVQVAIYQLNGKIIIDEQIQNTKYKLLTCNLTSGIYILKVKNQDGKWISKRISKL